jgi:drug/metabolite transporter (DMT)-like permease
MDHPLTGDLFAVGAAFFWALGVVLFKRCGETIPPLSLNLFKNTLALIFFIPAVVVMAMLGQKIPAPGWSWVWLALSGIVGITVADTLFFSALNRLGAGLNAVVDCLYAPSMIVCAMVVLGETLTTTQLIGGTVVVSAIAIGSITRPVAGRSRRDLITGIGLGSLGMVLMAVSIVKIKPMMTRETVIWVTTGRLVAGTVFLLPVIALKGEWARTARVFRPSSLWKIALPASFSGTVLAMGFWVAGLTLLDVSRSAILNQLSTIFIFILAAIVLRERVTVRRAIAVVLAFAGAVLVLTGGVKPSADQTASTDLTSGTCSFTRCSMPAFKVICDMGQPPQAPIKRT